MIYVAGNIAIEKVEKFCGTQMPTGRMKEAKVQPGPWIRVEAQYQLSTSIPPV